jgi:hypothetical protein
VLSFHLPFSCQSLLMEAGTVSAEGVLNVLSVPPALTLPPQGSLLASVLWELSPLLDLLNDTLAPANNARGWQMIAKDSSSTFTTPAQAGGGGVSIQPLAASVRITINFALQPFA